MIKDIIFFNNIALYQQCELEARKKGLKKSGDYIVSCAEIYLTKINNGEKKEYKKPMDLWIALSDVAKIENVKVAELIERICDDELNPKTVVMPVVIPEIPVVEPKKEGIIRKISDSLTLPRG
jgi:hypothetical protein